MIKITSNNSYKSFKQQITEIYSSHVCEIEELNSFIPKCKSTDIKQITPLTLNHEQLINSEYNNNFIEAINYIRYCCKEISNNIKKIDTRKWNDDEIIYDISEFYTIKPKTQNRRLTQKDIVMNTFSYSNLRYLAIKSEIIIYIYYLILSNSLSFDDISTFIGGIKYAVSVSNDTINGKARYLWELTTLFNIYINDNSIESYMPTHHCFIKERNLLYENIFGQYSNIDDENETIINEYIENYKNIIHTIKILIHRPESTLDKLITTLANITKTETRYIITKGIVIN